MLSLLPLLLLAASALAAERDTEHLEPSGFVYREHSLTKPYLGSGMVMPYWDFIGNAVVSDDFIRLTPDRQSKRGALWNSRPMRRRDFEVTFQFHVHGQGKSLFGDGFAMWYTRDKTELGDVFGSKDRFQGLGIFFDTYSNQQIHHRSGAYISALVNDGSIEYDHDADGTHQEMASCSADFRNKEYNTYARLIYRQRTLKLQLDVEGEGRWSTCFYMPDVYLPTGYYLGFSAATGDLADNHDIISIQVAEPPKLTVEEVEEMQRLEAAKEKEGNVDGERVEEEVEIDKPRARFHAPEREHVGPKRAKTNFRLNMDALDRMKRDTSTKAAPSSFWLYFALITILIVGVAGVTYKVKVLDKKKSERFSF